MGRAGIYSLVTAAAAATPPARLAALPSEAAGAAEGCARPGLRCCRHPVPARPHPVSTRARALGAPPPPLGPAAAEPCSPGCLLVPARGCGSGRGPRPPIPPAPLLRSRGRHAARQGKVSRRETDAPALLREGSRDCWVEGEGSRRGTLELRGSEGVRDVARTDLELSSLH